MEKQSMPDYETIRAAVAGEKWAVEKVVACYQGEIDRQATVTQGFFCPYCVTKGHEKSGVPVLPCGSEKRRLCGSLLCC